MALRAFSYEEIPSTQDQAWLLVEQGEAPPFFVTAQRQTRGRGRQNRIWHFEEGRSLALTLVIERPVQDLSALSLICGLSVLKLLKHTNLKIKWPNDLMLDDSKVGGILIESRSLGSKAIVAIGMGLNLTDQVHASYRGLKGIQIPSTDVFAQFVHNFLESSRAQGFAAHAAEFESVLWKLGEEVTMVWDGESHTVKIEGVTEQGHLKIENAGELSLKVDGEILHEA